MFRLRGLCSLEICGQQLCCLRHYCAAYPSPLGQGSDMQALHLCYVNILVLKGTTCMHLGAKL